MFLSFIVPVYNVEKYLEECLDSLLDQDIEKSDYEIICVNDGSTDGSLEIPAYLYRTRAGSAQTSDSRPSRIRKLNSYLNAAYVMQGYWQKGRRDQSTANLLMGYIWYTMHMAVRVSGTEGRAAVSALKKAGLYPFRRPDACTLQKSYQTTRTDAVGKLFDKVYINMHRPWGFAAMKLLRGMIQLKHSFRK